MTIFVLIPVHNRVEMTRQCVLDLIAQDFEGGLEIIVIDDGSTDGTFEQLKVLATDIKKISNRRIQVIVGSGDWWWTKCIETALSYVRPMLDISDSVLLLNDDVRLGKTYVSELLRVKSLCGECIVMSQLVNIENVDEYIPSPVIVSQNNLQISSVTNLEYLKKDWVQSDVAPGRGALYPAMPIMEGHTVGTRQLPHYVADYEFSVRMSRLGYPIVCASSAHVVTSVDWGNSKAGGNIFWSLTAKESPKNIRAHWAFWRTWSPELSRGSLLLKMFRYKVIPSILKINRLETTR
jgi:GT2 family glycosyltransferase